MSRASALVVFHAGEISGPLRSLEREITWMAGRFDVEVTVPQGAARWAGFEDLGARVVEGPYRALTMPGGPIAAVRQTLAARREADWFSARIAAIDPAVILVVTSAVPAALRAADAAAAPAVTWVGELWTGAGRGPVREAAGRALLRWVASRSASVIACSDAVARQFGPGVEVTTIHPPVKPQPATDGGSFRARHGIDRRAPLLASVGSITAGRGQDVLLRALPALLDKHPGLRCVIEGEVFDRPADLAFSERLDRLTGELGLTGVVVRTAGSTDLAGLYASADVVVNPATTHPESFGRVALEAGLAGTPAVISTAGMTAELHGDGQTALLVEPGSAERLGEAISRVLASPDLGGRLAAGSAGLARELCDPEANLQLFASVVEGVLADGGSAR